MKRSTKKGFTIVELVIVIAIIAILAAVLIPTFASLIQKANESKDTQLVKNLNTALAADNKEHKTMTDALDAAVEFGYDVGKINASATGNEILWDSKNDVFCYLKDGKVEYIPETSLKNGAVAENETYKLWKIYTEAPTEQTFSIYWNSDKAFDKELTVGFDAGNNTATTALTYKGTAGNSVIIRTNSYDTVLTIDAVKDSVKHFDKVGSVVITAVAPKSYHEFGDVQGNISLANGRVVMESGSKASAVKVTATADDVSKGNATVAVDNTAAPTVAVVVPADVKTALEKAGGDNKLNASNDSVITDETTIANMDKFAGGLGTEDSPYLISNYDQLLNIKDAKSAYFKLTADIVIAKDAKVASGTDKCVTVYFSGTLDGNGHSITNNYEVHGSGNWFALFDKVTGKKTTVKNLTLNYGTTWFNIASHVNGNLTVENVVLTSNGNTVNVTESGNNYGVIASKCLGYSTYKDYNIVIKNVKSFVNVEAGNGYIGVWFGTANPNNNYTYENVINYGNVNAGSISYFFGNVGNSIFIDPMKSMVNSKKAINIKLVDSYNYGAIYGTNNSVLLSYGEGKDYLAENEAAMMKSINKEAGAIVKVSSSGNIAITKNADSSLTITKTSAAAKHVISYSTYWHFEDGNHALFTVTFDIDASEKNYYAHFASIKDGNTEGYKLLENSPRTCENGMQFYVAEKDGEVYYLFNNVNEYIYSTPEGTPTFNAASYPTVKVLAYDNSGKLIDYSIVK